MSTRNCILESLYDHKINESTDAKIADNINDKKFSNLQKIAKSYGYHITEFGLWRYKPTSLNTFIVIEPIKMDDWLMPSISFNEDKFYVHPRLMTDLDDKDAQKFITGMTKALDLCKVLNAEMKHINDYLVKDMPSEK